MSAENKPNNHKLIRILTAAGILGGTGAVVGGKVILDELSKPKAAASAEFTPSPASSVAINGERYVVAPTATAIPTETAVPPSPTATEKAAPTATRTATATATSIPEGYRSENGNLIYQEKEIKLNVLEIAGLKAGIEEINGQKKAVYRAEKDNPYGLAEKEYAGTFNPNVSVENKQTGGIILTAPIALKIMEKNIEGLGLTLPLDVSDNQTVSIKILNTEVYGMPRSYMVLGISGKAYLTNILNESQLKISKSIVKDEHDQPLWQYGSVGSTIDDPRKSRPFKPYVLFTSKTYPNNIITQKRFGDQVDEVVNGEIRLSYSDGSTGKTLTLNDALRTGGVPVFLASNIP